MDIFPIKDPVSRSYYSENIIREQQRSKFESGAVLSRPMFTSSRKKWTIGWKSLSDSSYKDLKSFFKKNIGKVFIWTNHRGHNFIVRFSKDFLSKARIVGFKNGEELWDTGKIDIEEK